MILAKQRFTFAALLDYEPGMYSVGDSFGRLIEK